jgi:large subunit ribosomal protein L22
MEITAILKYARISPKKSRDLARAIQGKPVGVALNITNFSDRKAARFIGKTLKSAIANAENNAGLDVEDLIVKTAVVEDGPVMKRFWCGARGMAKPIQKKMMHVRIVLSEV